MSVRELGQLKTDYAPLRVVEEEIRAYEPLPVNHLEMIAVHLRSMPYGTFMEYAEATRSEPDNLWKWAIR